MLAYFSLLTCVMVTLLVSLYITLHYGYQLLSGKIKVYYPRIATIAGGLLGVVASYNMLFFWWSNAYELLQGKTIWFGITL